MTIRIRSDFAKFQSGLYFACIVILVVLQSGTANATQLLWTSSGANNVAEIEIAQSNGSGVTPLLPPVFSTSVMSIAFDPRDQTVYYGRYAAAYTINRIGMNGSNPQTLYDLHTLDSLQPNIPNVTRTPHGLSVDLAHNKLYWTAGENNFGTSTATTTFIQRSNFDGTLVEVVAQGSSHDFSPAGLVVNGDLNKMYWSDFATSSIRTSALDGSGVQDLVTGVDFPYALAIDFPHGKMFWSDRESSYAGKIWVSNLDGTGSHTIITSGVGLVRGLAVDPVNSDLYLVDDQAFSSDKILRAHYDGSNIQLVANLGSYNPAGIAFYAVPEPASLLQFELGAAILALLGYRRSKRA